MKIQILRKNNQGFSLVELIVVVAIMAILVALITPSLLQYVDKAKKARDIECARVLGTAFNRVLATNEEASKQWYSYFVKKNGTQKAATVRYTVTDADGHSYDIGNMYEFTMNTGLSNSRFGILRNAHLGSGQTELAKCTQAFIEEIGQNNLYISYRKYGINEFRIAMNLETGQPEVWVCPVPPGTDGEGYGSGWVYLRLYPEPDPRYMQDFRANPPVATNAWGGNDRGATTTTRKDEQTFENVY